MYVKMAKAEGKVEAVCEGCFKRGKAVAFCRQCTAFLCAHCVEQHRVLRAFEGHKVETLNDLKRGGVAHAPVAETPLPKCLEHDEQMKIFCFHCNHLICRDSTVIDHNGHSYNFLKKCATEARRTLYGSLTRLRKIKANIAGADKKVTGTRAQVVSQKEEVSQTIKKSFHQQSRSGAARDRTAEKSADPGPGEGGCSDGSEEGVPNSPDRNPGPGRACGAERGEHQRPRSDGPPHTTAGQGGGGRETSSAAVFGPSHHCRYHMLPSLSR